MYVTVIILIWTTWAREGCVGGWYPYKERCYQFHGFGDDEIENRRSWEDAHDFCKEKGGMLAIVPDFEDCDHIIISCLILKTKWGCH